MRLLLVVAALLFAAPAYAQVDSVAAGIYLPVGLVVATPRTGCAYEYPFTLGGSVGTSFQLLTYPQCDEGPCAGMPEFGANSMNCLTQDGYACNLAVGQCVNTGPGSLVGAFKTALNDRFNLDTDQRENLCYEAYVGNGRRVLRVPLINAPSNGVTTVCINGFATAFLKRRIAAGGANSAMLLEFIGDATTTAHAATWGALKLVYR